MNSRPHSLVPSLRVALGLLLLLATGCTIPGVASRPATPAAAKADGAFNDDAHQPTSIESAVIAAGKDPAKLADLERDLLAKMTQPDATPALVQEAAQHLGYVIQAGAAGPAPATLAVLAPMLADPARVDYARLALDRVPGESVDASYLAALPKATGRNRLALIESTGSRGLTAAVPLLAPWINDADPALATATAQALGRIGGPAALAALESALHPLAPAVLNARLAAAAKIDAAAVARVAGEIYRNPAAPLPQRSAALRQLINADPAGAVDEIHTALSGTEPSFQAVAIHAVSNLPVADAGAKLAAGLGSYAPGVQVALIAALGHRLDAGAVPGLLPSLDSADASVRLATLDALGRLPGNADVARRLAVIATGKGDEAKAASSSLARLNGPGLDDLVRTGAATEGDEALRAVFLQQIAARNLTEAIPFLLGLRQSPIGDLRLEALDALRLIAAPADQQAVIDWAVATRNRNEQSRAVRALITIILRDGNLATRADTVIAALHAGDAAARQVLLPVLSRVTGAPALAVAGSLARDADEAVATAATAELARWPDASALPPLVDLAVATKTEGIRSAAVLGAARFLARTSDTTPERRSALTRTLLDLPLGVPERRALINVLSLCADQAALDTAKRFLADPATSAEAQDAVDALASSLAGPAVVTTSVDQASAAQMVDGNADSFWQVPCETGTWIRADLHRTRPVRKITLEHRGRGWGYPGAFEVQVSDNPDQPGGAVAQGEGERDQTVVSLPAGTRGRYVWLRLTGRRDAPLAIAELRVE